jgi:hypothetical protein
MVIDNIFSQRRERESREELGGDSDSDSGYDPQQDRANSELPPGWTEGIRESDGRPVLISPDSEEEYSDPESDIEYKTDSECSGNSDHE